jgi:hypothetical protein
VKQPEKDTFKKQGTDKFKKKNILPTIYRPGDDQSTKGQDPPKVSEQPKQTNFKKKPESKTVESKNAGPSSQKNDNVTAGNVIHESVVKMETGFDINDSSKNHFKKKITLKDLKEPETDPKPDITRSDSDHRTSFQNVDRKTINEMMSVYASMEPAKADPVLIAEMAQEQARRDSTRKVQTPLRPKADSIRVNVKNISERVPTKEINSAGMKLKREWTTSNLNDNTLKTSGPGDSMITTASPRGLSPRPAGQGQGQNNNSQEAATQSPGKRRKKKLRMSNINRFLQGNDDDDETGNYSDVSRQQMLDNTLETGNSDY